MNHRSRRRENRKCLFFSNPVENLSSLRCSSQCLSASISMNNWFWLKSVFISEMISSGKEGREHGCVDIMSGRGDLMTLNQLLPTLSELVPSGFIESHVAPQLLNWCVNIIKRCGCEGIVGNLDVVVAKLLSQLYYHVELRSSPCRFFHITGRVEGESWENFFGQKIWYSIVLYLVVRYSTIIYPVQRKVNRSRNQRHDPKRWLEWITRKSSEKEFVNAQWSLLVKVALWKMLWCVNTRMQKTTSRYGTR